MSNKLVGIYYKHSFEPARLEANKLEKWLQKKGFTIFIEEMSPTGKPEDFYDKSSIRVKRLDWVVVLGGDGTLLGAARKVGQYHAPILGVNLGGLGFLTGIPLNRLYSAIEMILKGQLDIEERLMLRTKVFRSGEEIFSFKCLNDVVINKGALARILELDVDINNQFLTTFRADGLIVATPTGSTAYNLAAGGPILYPTMSNFILTPICPFTLTNRPIILPDSDIITIHMGKESEEKVHLTFDGQVGFDLILGDKVIIDKSDEKIRLFESPDQTYFELLRAKLMWGGATYNNDGNG